MGRRVLLLACLVGALALSGCVSPSSRGGLEWLRVYSLDEFEEALLEEKAGLLEAELRRVRYFGLSEPRETALTPLMEPEFPLLAEWMRVRAVARHGDEVREYREHADSRKDSQKAAARGYALVRDGRVIEVMRVDSSWCIEY